MQVTVEPKDGFTVVHLRGEFDALSAQEFQGAIEQLLEQDSDQVVVNLRRVTFINSTALGVIFRAKKGLARKGGNLVVSQPSEFCREIVERICFDRVVPIFDDDEAAGTALGRVD